MQEDDSKLTFVELGNVVASFFGTTFDFHNFMTNMAARVGSSLMPSFTLTSRYARCSSASRTSSRTSARTSLKTSARTSLRTLVRTSART